MAEDTSTWWSKVTEKPLRQGDLLASCSVPIVPPNFQPEVGKESEVAIEQRDVIVITQSCDLEQRKARVVALCPVYSLEIWSQADAKFKKPEEREKVRQGRYEGLHMLASPTKPDSNGDALVVDFREIYSLPLEYLESIAEKQKERCRLKSPYLEHLAQSFARFFMRVGLPSSISSFKK